jgi:hypothetical protein
LKYPREPQKWINWSAVWEDKAVKVNELKKLKALHIYGTESRRRDIEQIFTFTKKIQTIMVNDKIEKVIKDENPQNFIHIDNLKERFTVLANYFTALYIKEQMIGYRFLFDNVDKIQKYISATIANDITELKMLMSRYNVDNKVHESGIIKELYDLYKWGDLHQLYKMTIPASYFGHKDVLDRGLLKEFYSLELADNANKWVLQDIITNYGTDYRVHIVRVTMKTVELVQNACIRQGVAFRNHTSTDRLSPDQINEFFKEPLKRHIVLGVKGFFRRANLIPNRWKLRIGATHEYYTPNIDYNVQIQGLTGRMTGYWRDIIEKGHKTGPHRTSIIAVEAYEKTYINHLGLNSYKTAGFTMKNGVVHKEDTMFSETNVGNLEAKELPIVRQKGQMPIVVININDEEKSKFTKKCIFDLINKYDQEVVASYKKYKLHLWNIDDASKEEKYGLISMLRPNAVSGLTNIREKDKTKQVLMIYLHENKLIISAWNGEEFKAYQ